MIDNLPWIERAILVYGPRKGGTTLFQNLLDGGKEVFVYPAELKLKYMIKMETLTPKEYLMLSRLPTNEPQNTKKPVVDSNSKEWEPPAYSSHSRGYGISSDQFDRAGYDAEWNDDKSNKSHIGDLVRKDILRVYKNCLTKPAQPQMWCAKEVGGRQSAILDLWKRSFPKGRVLLLARDPLMVTRAVIRDRHMVGQKMSIRDIIKQTYDPMAVNAFIAKERNSSTAFAICYEDLVRDTAGTMKAVAIFLGIEYSVNFNEPSILGEKVIVRTSSRADPNIFVSQANWTEGLTLREKTIIALTSCLLRISPRFWKSYGSLRRQIKARNPIPNDR